MVSSIRRRTRGASGRSGPPAVHVHGRLLRPPPMAWYVYFFWWCGTAADASITSLAATRDLPCLTADPTNAIPHRGSLPLSTRVSSTRRGTVTRLGLSSPIAIRASGRPSRLLRTARCVKKKKTHTHNVVATQPDADVVPLAAMRDGPPCREERVVSAKRRWLDSPLTLSLLGDRPKQCTTHPQKIVAVVNGGLIYTSSS